MPGLFSGPDESGTTTIVTGDNDAPATVVEIPDGALYQVERVLVQYSQDATVDFDLTLYDETDGTAAADVADDRHAFLDIAPDDSIDQVFDGMRYFEEDVLVQSNGDHDGDVSVTVQGKLLTTLTDVMQ